MSRLLDHAFQTCRAIRTSHVITSTNHARLLSKFIQQCSLAS